MRKYRISNASGVSAIEAGLGMVHAETIVATPDDELRIDPPSLRFELEAAGTTTSSRIADLGLGPGWHACSLRVLDGTAVVRSGAAKLLLVDPSRRCRKFGARYGSLEYHLPVVTGRGETASWQSLWHTGEVSDIVVDFDGPHKFVLWRGMSFAPSWAMDNVLTSTFFAETVEPGVFRDCCEIMSDRECRYTHARVIHSSDARVVIHWRYPLCDSSYTICRHQWADEMYFVYPDGVACRNVTIYLDPNDEAVWVNCPRTGRRVPAVMIGSPPGKRTFNDTEFITVNAPGATSEDNTPLEALTLLDGSDYRRSFRWPKPPDFSKESVPELSEYIFRMNYRHRPGVFVASAGEGMRLRLQGNDGMRYEPGDSVEDDRWTTVPDLPSKFADFIHWPITRGCGTTPLTDRETYNERPTHTFLGFAEALPVDVSKDGAATWCWLTGIAPEDERVLRAKVRAWVRPGVVPGACYDSKQGAYIVERAGARTQLAVGPEALTCPTFVLPGVECAQLRAVIDDGHGPGHPVAVGVERSVGRVQTVLTFSGRIPAGSRVAIEKGDG